MRRPAVMAAAALAFGIVFEYQFRGDYLFMAAAAAVIAILVLWGIPRCAAVFLCIMLLGSMLLCLEMNKTDPLASFEGQSTDIRGTVISVKDKVDHITVLVNEERGGRLLLSVYGTADGECELEEGQGIRAYCSVEKPSAARNPGGFDYRLYLLSIKTGHVGTASPRQIKITGVDSGFRNAMWKIRSGFMEKIGAYMDRGTSGMVNGMLFGDKAGLAEDTYESFQENGTAHILAVSGLHVGMIYGLICAVIGGRRRVSTNAVILALIIMYAAMSGFTLSVMRAVLMISMHILSRLLHYRYDLMSSAAVTMIVMLVYEPYELFNTGFQLSFLAVLSLAAMMPYFANVSWHPVIKNTLLPVVIIQTGMAPYTAYVFNYFSAGAFLANIPVVFLSGIIVPAGAIAMVLVSLLPGSAGIAAAFMEAGVKSIVFCNDFFYADGATSFRVVSPPLLLIFLYYGLLFYFVSEMTVIGIMRRRWSRVMLGSAAVVMAALMIWSGWSNDFKEADMVFVDVGQGSSVHLRTPAGKNVLIDGGGKRDVNMGRKVLKPYLLKNGVSHVDLALATHFDTDHYKGLKELAAEGMADRVMTYEDDLKAGDVLMREKNFMITVVAPLSAAEPAADEFGGSASAAGEAGGRVSAADEKEAFAGEAENEKSLVLRVDSGSDSLLFTGDIGKEKEREIVEYWKGTDMLDCDIIAAPHHGSKNSSSDELIKAVSPAVAVIQVGKNNYGHPAPETLAAYRRAGVMILRNDMLGAIGVFAGLSFETVTGDEAAGGKTHK